MRGIKTLSLAMLSTLSCLSLADNWYLENSLSVSSAVRLHGEDKLTNQVNSWGLKAEYDQQAFSFRFDGELRYNAAYDLHEGFSDEAKQEYQKSLWLDEAYLAYSLEKWDFALGYQKVVWGKADDLRIVDVVNPLDLENFILFDVDEYRLSSPMLKAETSTANNWDLTFLYLLDFKENKYPVSGSEFGLASLPKFPTKQAKGGEFGMAATTFWQDTDIALYLFNGYNDNPVFELNESAVNTSYKRETMLAYSLSRPVSDWIVRHELALFNERSFSLNNGTLAKRNEWQALLGLDYLYTDWLFTGQISNTRIQSWHSEFINNKHEPIYTLSADTSFLSGSLNARLALSHSDSNGGGQLYQTKFSYIANEHWKFQMNIDLLSGNDTNLFGMFKDNDRIWLSSTYTF